MEKQLVKYYSTNSKKNHHQNTTLDKLIPKLRAPLEYIHKIKNILTDQNLQDIRDNINKIKDAIGNIDENNLLEIYYKFDAMIDTFTHDDNDKLEKRAKERKILAKEEIKKMIEGQLNKLKKLSIYNILIKAIKKYYTNINNNNITIEEAKTKAIKTIDDKKIRELFNDLTSKPNIKNIDDYINQEIDDYINQEINKNIPSINKSGGANKNTRKILQVNKQKTQKHKKKAL